VAFTPARGGAGPVPLSVIASRPFQHAPFQLPVPFADRTGAIPTLVVGRDGGHHEPQCQVIASSGLVGTHHHQGAVTLRDDLCPASGRRVSRACIAMTVSAMSRARSLLRCCSTATWACVTPWPCRAWLTTRGGAPRTPGCQSCATRRHPLGWVSLAHGLWRVEARPRDGRHALMWQSARSRGDSPGEDASCVAGPHDGVSDYDSPWCNRACGSVSTGQAICVQRVQPHPGMACLRGSEGTANPSGGVHSCDWFIERIRRGWRFTRNASEGSLTLMAPWRLSPGLVRGP